MQGGLCSCVPLQHDFVLDTYELAYIMPLSALQIGSKWVRHYLSDFELTILREALKKHSSCG